MFKGLIALWSFCKWILSIFKSIDRQGAAYFTIDRALSWRLQAEKVFRALETGKLDKLPKPLQWLFGRMELDNRIGVFGTALLKSNKLAEDKKVLDQPLYKVW